MKAEDSTISADTSETNAENARPSGDIGVRANELYQGDIFSRPLPHQENGRRPLCTIANLEEILKRMGVRVRYNEIAKKVECTIPNFRYSVDNSDLTELSIITNACMRFRMQTEKLGLFLTAIADRDRFNPVAEWIVSRGWDGRDRLAELYATIQAVGETDNPITRVLKEIMIRRWMISCVAAAFNSEGVSSQGVLVLQGNQGLGKTRWLRQLTPSHLNVFAEGLTLDPKDRDSVYQAIQNWIVELGELDATFRKADIAQLKSFITRDRDTIRLPYAQRSNEFPRRTVFCASVNPDYFLNDPTGSRRFWTIACESVNHRHSIDMQQVWAQVKSEYYDNGEPIYLSREEAAELNEHNEQFSSADPIFEMISSHYNWSTIEQAFDERTATSVLAAVGISNPTHAQARAAGAALRKLSKFNSRKSNGNRLFRVPKRHCSY